MEAGLVSPSYGTYSETTLHPAVIACLLLAGIIMLAMRPKYALIPILFISFFIPLGQRIVIEGLDFQIYRVVILFGWVRMFIGSKHPRIKLNSIDKAVILWVIASVVSYTLLWQTTGAFINRMGFAYNVFGIYFLARLLIQDMDDVDRIIKTLIAISVIISIFMVIEQINGRNMFSIFGGVPEFTPERAGRLRSQGAFAHAILAGTFGATLIPLFISLWWRGRQNKKLVIIGCISATVITLASASSGPLFTLIAGLMGLYMWRWRRHMNKIRWGVFLSLISLHILMKAPVWALIGRVGIVGGSSAFHRFNLVDQFITRIDEWWLFGTKSTDHWGWMMWDTSNQYVSEGTMGGLVTLILFITILVRCFRGIGLKIKEIKNNSSAQLGLWALGAAITAHMVGFMGVSYFDQIIVVWYMLLAIVATLSNLRIEAFNKEPQDFRTNYRLPKVSSQPSFLR